MGVLKIRNAADTGWIELGGIETVYQSASAPTSPHAGQLWLDTDATPDNGIAHTYDTWTSTSGTSHTFSGLGENVDRMVLRFHAVSTSATSQPPIVQFYNQSAWQATGYHCYTSYGSGKSSYTDGFYTHDANNWAASDDVYGTMIIERMSSDGTLWSYLMVTQSSPESTERLMNGQATLTTAFGGQIRIITPGGTATFDLGTVWLKSTSLVAAT